MLRVENEWLSLRERLLPFVLALLLAACSQGGQTPSGRQTQDALYTAAAVTIQAQLAGPAAVAPSETSAPVATSVVSALPPAAPTGAMTTPSPSVISPQPPAPQASPTPAVVLIRARVDTNCRAGPSADFEAVGYLVTDQTARVLGRDSASQWWYIELSERLGQFCWVWGETTELEGDLSRLPVITPPVTSPLSAPSTQQPSPTREPAQENTATPTLLPEFTSTPPADTPSPSETPQAETPATDLPASPPAETATPGP
jgi:hypothetical protein